jgi:2-dehydro-3-deoxyphosphogluconate aldolase/(4S)-4-hydroxy-2-oxoglutarate aldolase
MQATLNPELVPVLRRARVVPVLTVEDAAAGVDIARALVAGGLDVIEVTLRTPAALRTIAAMANAVPSALIGAGTVLTPEQGRDAIGAGARLLVSPGMTPRLLEAAESWGQPYLPGAATASEAMALADLGYRALKFFPAEPAGGVGYLRALAAPLPEVAFCPTGGIGAANGAAYLALPNVLCVGGSWVVPEAAVAARDWAAITRLAKAAVALGPR